MNITLKIGALLLLFQSTLLGQSPNSKLKEPEVGMPCPEFVLSKIDFYKKNTLALSELRGKWVVLDFWAKNCSGCIASLPTISKEQIAFGENVQFIMVAPDSKPDERLLYTNYKQKLNLAMPSAFDTVLFKRFNVGLLPHTIIIDPSGIIRAITTAPDSLKLRALIAGKNPVFNSPTFADEKSKLNDFKYDYNALYLVDGNGGVDSNFLFRSLLTKWQPGNPRRFQNIIDRRRNINNGVFEFLRGSLEDLYMLAYYGKREVGIEDSSSYGTLFCWPVFEIKNMDLLNTDIATGKNLYCYSMKVPSEKATPTYMMQVMQSDLKNYFGYDVTIETRKMPYWRLIATDEARKNLITKGGPMIVSSNGRPWQENHLKNSPMHKLIVLVEYYSGVTRDDFRSHGPLIDETGITSNIDIDLDWAKGDFDVVRKALQKNGLDLVPGERAMKCVVVKDSKPEINLAERKN